MSQEIELKLSATPAQLKQVLNSALIRERALAPPRSENLHSVYYDDDALEVTRRGLALRLRKRGRRWLQTLKTRGESQAGLHSRGEFETAAPGGALDLDALAALEGAAELVEPLRALELKPLFATEFRRTHVPLKLADGGRAELAFDLGEIRAGDQVDPICEIEIELLEGSSSEVFTLARELLQLASLKLDNRSKAQRGFALLAPLALEPARAKAPALEGSMPAQRASARLLGAALEQLESNEAGLIAADDPEFLHQARVALRRLRALLRLFSPLLTLAEIEALKPRLRALGQALGACRDWDVLCTETLPRVRSGMTRPDALDPLAQAVREQRLGAQVAVRACLAERDYTDLKLALGSLIVELAQAAPADAPLLEDFAREQLQRAARKVRKRHQAHDANCIDSLHGLRIEVKKLRYACDVLGSVFGERKQRRYVRHLSELQQLLGDFNDAAIARQRVDSLAGIGPFPLGVVEGYAAARTEAARAALPQAWAEFEKAQRFW
ncbi:CYTH and CHAD domain-containing protein [uncultured Aquimonas sp.]|uniref:CYTH and CHAD domain-containing protein n=1 Tax=uncultured Aquimonas sp. TaxID=385483 RepID=UPI00086AB30C|nr:CYTH and CHAD domain-containing protein [uncultured Aquimonas sp.]ODU46480.1 MAG: hypothetical protein ABS96_09435 [Xanthomonadaceae bacterium SCN 69-123]